MPRAAAIYVIAADLHALGHVELALARLRGRIGAAGLLLVVAHPAVLARGQARLQAAGADRLLPLAPGRRGRFGFGGPAAQRPVAAGYLQGLFALREAAAGPQDWGPALLTGAHVFGPILDARAGPAASSDTDSGAGPVSGPVSGSVTGSVSGAGWAAEPGPGVGVLAGYWTEPRPSGDAGRHGANPGGANPGGANPGGVGPGGANPGGAGPGGAAAHVRVPALDFLVLSPAFLAHPAPWALWGGARADNAQPGSPSGRPDRPRIAGPDWDPMGFCRLLPETGLSADFLAAADFSTARPAVQEVHRLLEAGSPCLPVEAFTLDPLMQDIWAMRLRDAVDALRAADPPLYAATIGFVSREMRLRDFNTVADQYEVIAPTAAADPDRPRAFGTLAVFIHAFYAAMMPEFQELIARLPAARHLFITTASAADRDAILAFLDGQGTGADGATVRVVEQNRGRDMSSLFITWRDVVLSGDYEVALRLHSKRTPQVPRPVGESFKAHLFDNLVASRGHVSNLLDMIEADPDIGLVIPPVIQIGFGTLGHSWFNNRQGVAAALDRMGLSVPLDSDTPVAANGTMYWFRCAALRPMFETEWRWDEYNAEPDHVDGGLAHVQERLLAYVAQARGYRTVSVMTPRAAARGYARLEYKLQRLAARLPTGNIVEQDRAMAALTGTLRNRLYRRLRGLYGRIITRWPGARRWLRPPARAVSRLLLAGRSA